MAERKKKDTTTKLGGEARSSYTAASVALPKNQFDNVILFIKATTLERVAVLRNATWNALRQLRVGRDLGKAVAGIPAGSAHGDIQSLVVWFGKIVTSDLAAVNQLIAIDATCVARSG